MTEQEQNKTDIESAKQDLLQSCKEAIQENGIEYSLQQLMANQFGIESIQSDFHCLLLALLQSLVESKIVSSDKIDELYAQNKKTQEKQIKEYFKDTVE